VNIDSRAREDASPSTVKFSDLMRVPLNLHAMAATSAPGGGAVRVAVRAPVRALTPAEAGWVAAFPCALLLLAAVLVLAPPLGRLLFPVPRNEFFHEIAGLARPEPTEHTSYLFAIGAALMLCGAVGLASVRALPLRPATARRLSLGSQLALCAFAVVCVAAQHVISFGFIYTLGRPATRAYFTYPTIAVALLFAALAPLALRRAPVRRWLAGCLRETRARRSGALAAAAAFAAIWLLTAINLDSSVGHANQAVQDMLPWSMDETFAILDGRTPLVNFHPQYAQLWPYAIAGAMALLGSSLALYTTLMSLVSLGGLLAVFAVFRHVTRSSLAALALFAPFLATSFFLERGPLDDRYGPGNLLTIFPVRYAGPFALAWLLARHFDRGRPRRRWPIFLLAGVVAINNVEFGIAAFGATLAACAWARPPRSRAAGLTLARDAAAGLAGAIALVSLLTLVRSGSLPDFALAFQFSKLFGLTGWGMLPMPHLGFHLIVYATFVGALALATVRAAARDEQPAMTAMLAFAGVFGLGVGAYYAGRSHPEVLINVFAAWMLALCLLVVAAVRALAARRSGRPTLVELAILALFGLAICSIAQTPTPWGQIRRLQDRTSVPAFGHNEIERFIARETRRGEHVLLLTPLGHRYAYDLGLVNVSPYASIESIPTLGLTQEAIAALQAAHGTKVFLWYADTPAPALRALEQAGFAPKRLDRATETLELAQGGA
jgi:hypothetical protein